MELSLKDKELIKKYTDLIENGAEEIWAHWNKGIDGPVSDRPDSFFFNIEQTSAVPINKKIKKTSIPLADTATKPRSIVEQLRIMNETWHTSKREWHSLA